MKLSKHWKKASKGWNSGSKFFQALENKKPAGSSGFQGLERLLLVVLEDEGAYGAHAELLASKKNPRVAGNRFFCLQKTDLMIEAGIDLAKGASATRSGVNTTVSMSAPVGLPNHLIWNYKHIHHPRLLKSGDFGPEL